MGNENDKQAAGELIEAWRTRGGLLDTPNGNVFFIDTGNPHSAGASSGVPPLLIIHGFPTSSFDFRSVIDHFAASRRVILFDQIGFGLSDKPDRRYGIHLHADTTESVISELGLTRLDLLTHDMGDSVGGELLARHLDRGTESIVHKRVLTNGSIYLDMAQLTIGQQLLMSLPDEATSEIPTENFVNGVKGTFAEGSVVDEVDSIAHGLLAQHNGGLTLMARLIRYLEDRQAEESRYTGAIETHPAPLHVVWGELDPVAVNAMAGRLGERTRLRGQGQVTIEMLEGVGHYPMIESPEQFADAVLRGLD